jgi:hypothetical protein
MGVILKHGGVDRSILVSGSIPANTNISVEQYCVVMAGDASGAAPSPIWKFTTESFAASRAMIQSRT